MLVDGGGKKQNKLSIKADKQEALANVGCDNNCGSLGMQGIKKCILDISGSMSISEEDGGRWVIKEPEQKPFGD